MRVGDRERERGRWLSLDCLSTCCVQSSVSIAVAPLNLSDRLWAQSTNASRVKRTSRRSCRLSRYSRVCQCVRACMWDIHMDKWRDCRFEICILLPVRAEGILFLLISHLRRDAADSQKYLADTTRNERSVIFKASKTADSEAILTFKQRPNNRKIRKRIGKSEKSFIVPTSAQADNRKRRASKSLLSK